LLEIGRAKKVESGKEARDKQLGVLSQNDNTPKDQSAKINTQKEIAKAAGTSTKILHRRLFMDDPAAHAIDRIAFSQWQAQQHLDDDHEPIEQPAHGLDAETVRALVLLVLPPCDVHLSHTRLRTAFKRFLILASLIDDQLAARGLDAIAQALTEAGIKTTRASLSATHIELADLLGGTRLGRSKEAREAYSKRAKAIWGLRQREKSKRLPQASMGQE
jgi:hypothetical protein